MFLQIPLVTEFYRHGIRSDIDVESYIVDFSSVFPAFTVVRGDGYWEGIAEPVKLILLATTPQEYTKHQGWLHTWLERFGLDNCQQAVGYILDGSWVDVPLVQPAPTGGNKSSIELLA